jgi:hypothetical protein
MLSGLNFEGPEKATRGGVNESQSKFIAGTWPISEIDSMRLFSNSIVTA